MFSHNEDSHSEDDVKARGADSMELDAFTLGIAASKAGIGPKVVAAWIALFANSGEFLVSIENGPKTALVFGPPNDRNYVAVFTRVDFAQRAMQEFRQLKFARSVNVRDLAEWRAGANRGLWINPRDDVYTVKYPNNIITPLIAMASRAPGSPPEL